MAAVWEFFVSRFIRRDEGRSALSSTYSDSLKSYAGFFEQKDGSENTDSDGRQKDSNTVAKHYYDLATDFYEYGWGECFHFAPRHLNESLAESIQRHEFYLCSQLGLKKGDKVLDAGCGIMGPARNIARFSRAHITGLNLNAYQVNRCNALNAKSNISQQLACVEGNFAKTDFPSNTFDHIYSIEAFCHAPDRLAVFSEMFRLLKPGGSIAIYDWVMTDNYDENNSEHASIKHFIEKGNGIAKLLKTPEIVETMKASGFEIEVCEDLAARKTCQDLGNDVPWYEAFQGRYRCSQQFLTTPIGRGITQTVLNVLDYCRIAPTGTAKMHEFLNATAEALLKSGQLGIFTPMLFIVAQKPAAK